MTNDGIVWGDASQSQYLSKDDILPDGQVVTINRYEKHDIESRDGKVATKMVCFFDELDKPLVVNKTNADAIHHFTGAQMPLDSVGRKIEIFVDPSVAFGGQITGGIRVRPAVEIPA